MVRLLERIFTDNVQIGLDFIFTGINGYEAVEAIKAYDFEKAGVHGFCALVTAYLATNILKRIKR